MYIAEEAKRFGVPVLDGLRGRWVVGGNLGAKNDEQKLPVKRKRVDIDIDRGTNKPVPGGCSVFK
jgi:hypothetical protein